MVEEKLDDMMQQMGWRMQQQGFSMEQYLKLIGQTEQQMRDMYRSETLNNVKTELVIDEIIKAENIEATDEDVNKLLGLHRRHEPDGGAAARELQRRAAGFLPSTAPA